MITRSLEKTISFTTMMKAVNCVRQQSATSDSITIEWNSPLISTASNYHIQVMPYHEQNLWNSLFGPVLRELDEEDGVRNSCYMPDSTQVEPLTKICTKKQLQELQDFTRSFENLPGDIMDFEIDNLPEVMGSGFPFEVSLQMTMKTVKGNVATSEFVTEILMTNPHPPTNLQFMGKLGLQWTKSETPYVTAYEVSWIEETFTKGREEKKRTMLIPVQDKIAPVGRCSIILTT